MGWFSDLVERFRCKGISEAGSNAVRLFYQSRGCCTPWFYGSWAT